LSLKSGVFLRIYLATAFSPAQKNLVITYRRGTSSRNFAFEFEIWRVSPNLPRYGYRGTAPKTWLATFAIKFREGLLC
jgi:hypothetical protein